IQEAVERDGGQSDRRTHKQGRVRTAALAQGIRHAACADDTKTPKHRHKGAIDDANPSDAPVEVAPVKFRYPRAAGIRGKSEQAKTDVVEQESFPVLDDV